MQASIYMRQEMIADYRGLKTKETIEERKSPQHMLCRSFKPSNTDTDFHCLHLIRWNMPMEDSLEENETKPLLCSQDREERHKQPREMKW